MLCLTVSCCVMLCHAVSHCVMLRHAVSCCISLCHAASCCVMLCHAASGYSVSHTTRPQGQRESHGRDYYFIDDGTFDRALKSVRTHAPCISRLPVSSSLLTSMIQGEFIQTYQAGGYRYGLTMAAVEQVAQQGLACVTHMSIEVYIYTSPLRYSVYTLYIAH